MELFFQGIVFLLLAIPFGYMLFDVTRDLFQQAVVVVSKKAKPFVSTIISSLSR